MKCRIRMLVSVLVLAGCATSVPEPEAVQRSGDVAVRPLIKIAGARRLEMPENEVFNAPLAEVTNAVPDYPAALLAQRLPPQVVCVRVSIGEDGSVIGTAPVEQPPQCPTAAASEPAFVDAAAQAARGWRFDPAFRCIYPDAASVQPGCAPGMPQEKQAVSLVYRFVFEQRDGQGSVQVSR